MFKTINRDVLILKPKQAFFNWVQKVFEDELMKEGHPFAHDESNIYLIPEFNNHEEGLEYLKKNYKPYMAEELEGWVLDDNEWPKDFSWKRFQEFFHISIQSVVYDTLEEPILKEEFDNDVFFSLN